jgi:hypothetical protein
MIHDANVTGKADIENNRDGISSPSPAGKGDVLPGRACFRVAGNILVPSEFHVIVRGFEMHWYDSYMLW